MQFLDNTKVIIFLDVYKIFYFYFSEFKKQTKREYVI